MASILNQISEIFAHKYGKKYADACKVDSLNNVNDKVKKRLGLEPPSKLLVEQYLMEIAKNFNVTYEPDREVMTVSFLTLSKSEGKKLSTMRPFIQTAKWNHRRASDQPARPGKRYSETKRKQQQQQQ